jgi:hypothetical protein
MRTGSTSRKAWPYSPCRRKWGRGGVSSAGDCANAAGSRGRTRTVAGSYLSGDLLKDACTHPSAAPNETSIATSRTWPRAASGSSTMSAPITSGADWLYGDEIPPRSHGGCGASGRRFRCSFRLLLVCLRGMVRHAGHNCDQTSIPKHGVDVMIAQRVCIPAQQVRQCSKRQPVLRT